MSTFVLIILFFTPFFVPDMLHSCTERGAGEKRAGSMCIDSPFMKFGGQGELRERPVTHGRGTRQGWACRSVRMPLERVHGAGKLPAERCAHPHHENIFVPLPVVQISCVHLKEFEPHIGT